MIILTNQKCLKICLENFYCSKYKLVLHEVLQEMKSEDLILKGISYDRGIVRTPLADLRIIIIYSKER